ncbi:MAG: M14 family zinc carboxypeptidase [Candidatus Hodarchaeota archaeon]
MKSIKKPTKYVILLLVLASSFSFNSVARASYEQTLVCVQVGTPPVVRSWTNITLIYDNQFHDPMELQEEIDRIHNLVPDLVDIGVIGQSIQGRNLTYLRITNEQNTEQKAKTLVVAQHHGREQITVEASLRFILHLLNNYGIDEGITQHIDNQEIYVIPTLNPDALEIVVNLGNHWLRKNLRPYDNDGDGAFDEDPVEDVDGDGHIYGADVYTKNGSDLIYEYSYYEGIDNDGDGLINEDEAGLVDLNRNYATFWRNGTGWSPDPTNQVYPGTTPFSEPETDSFRQFALQHRFAMAYSLHSGINATYFLGDERGWYPEPNLYLDILADFYKILPSGFFPTSNLRSKGSQNSDLDIQTGLAGGWGEWMYYERGTLVPITFEIYHNASVDQPEAITTIVDNSTHFIEKWNGIYGFFAPEEQFINNLS